MRARIETIAGESPKCPECGCTERTRYEHVSKRLIRDEKGRVIRICVVRYTSCKECGTRRRESSREIPSQNTLDLLVKR